MTDIAMLVLMASVVTKIVDTFRNAFDPEDSVKKVVWNLTSFGLGITIAVTGGFNILGGLHPNGLLGELFTGMMLGAGASGVHEFFDLMSARGSGGGKP